HVLDQELATRPLSAEAAQALAAARGNFVSGSGPPGLPDADRALAESLIRQALADGIRIVMWLAAALALAGAACAAVMIRPAPEEAPQRRGSRRNPLSAKALSRWQFPSGGFPSGGFPSGGRIMPEIRQDSGIVTQITTVKLPPASRMTCSR